MSLERPGNLDIEKLGFGVFDHLDRSDLPLREYYEERLKLIELLDRAGFYAYHVAEHHFTPLGMAPSPSVFLAAIAQRTRQLRLGTFVYALPLHHPLRVLEEICMLDHLSGGRIEIGFGRGSVPYEVSYYGQDAEHRQEIYAERVELILKAFSAKTLTWHGRYDRFDDVPIEIGPLQTPHPPLWYGAHSPDSATRAAHRGMHVVCNDPPALARAILRRYREVWNQLHAAAPKPRIGLVRFVLVADSDAEAMSIARRGYARWLRSFNHLHDKHRRPPAGARPETFDGAVADGIAVAGAPETVRSFLSSQIGDCGANYLVGQFAFGDLTLAEMARSVTLFTDEVMPALRADRSACAAASA